MGSESKGVRADDPQSRQPRYAEMIVETDIDIPMRDGLCLKANVFRPKAEGTFPVILSMGPYHKDTPSWEGSLATPTAYPAFEQLSPEDYVPAGYVMVRIDTRGSGHSPGFLQVFHVRESEDYYDAVEWAARQPWSSGAVGLSGSSYLGINQWNAAARRPPHLKAIVPWEALTDHYRHSTYPGGIYREAFQGWYMNLMEDHLLRPEAREANQNVGAENTMFLAMQHRLDDQFWQDHSSDAFTVDVPVLTASAWPNWGGVGHLRGSTEGFKEVASRHKRMVIYTTQFDQGTITMYTEDGTREHRRWFDRFLKGIDNGVDQEPPVRLAIRRSTNPADFTWRSENEWPIARTQYTKFYLDAANGGTLSHTEPAAASTAHYKSGPLITIANLPPEQVVAALFGAGADTTGVTFTSAPFDQETEVTGELALYLQLASTLKDTDIHAMVSIVHANGKEEVVTRGWLKASHRKLDLKRSTPSMPYHTHDEEQYLTPGEPVDLAIDIWATSMLYAAGSRLRLRVAPSSPGFFSCSIRAAMGENTLFTGGSNPSYLLVPIVPPKEVGI